MNSVEKKRKQNILRNLLVIVFSEIGSGANPQGALGAGPAGSLRLIAASMGPVSRNGTRKLAIGTRN